MSSAALREWLWCAPTTLSCFAGWISEFQTLIAGTLAVVGGGLAFGGAYLQARAATQQAKAMVDVAADERAERRRAIAAALWSELNYCYARMIVEMKHVAETANIINLEPLSTAVFDANPQSVGYLDPTVAYAVTYAYGVTKNLSNTYTRYSQLNQAGPFPELADQIAEAADLVRGIIDGFSDSGGFPADAVDAMRQTFDEALAPTTKRE